MKIQKIAREKLVEKNIDWKQVYTEKTMFLKEQYEDIIGPGSYFRFEGQDLDTGNEYYCIIGPAKIHDPIAKFFAGVRKLPATYSAGGKYFDSMDEASNYAQETWGVPRPRSLKPYTSSSLHGIKKKVEEWKEDREDREENEKEASCGSNGCFWKRAAKDDYPVTQLPRSDEGAIRDQERTPVERQRDYYPEETKALETYDSMMRTVLDQEEKGAVTQELDRDLLKNIIGIVLRDTGVPKQVGQETWDIRSTFTHQDKNGKTMLENVLPLLEDVGGGNIRIRDIKRKTFKQPNGTETSGWTIPVYDEETGSWKQQYLTRDIQKVITHVAHKAKELLNQGIYLDPSEEQDVDVFGVDDQTETRENLDDDPFDEIGGEFSLGDPDDEFGDPSEDLSSALEDMGLGMDPSLASDERSKKVFSNTMKNLIKIAKDVDDKGNSEHAEEIHKVIRKYIERAK
jgi:hypothetical protein